MALKLIDPILDFIFYYESAPKDFKRGKTKASIKGNGQFSLFPLINWNSTYSYDPNDSGGKTLFGVTEASWIEYVKTHPKEGLSKDLNTMGYNGWLKHVEWYWDKSYCSSCANLACACVMLQMKWVGFGSKSLKNLLKTLKDNADKKEYQYTNNKNIYAKIADATKAFTDPMIAYDYMRKANATYLYNLSSPGNKNAGYRMGWLNRSALSYTQQGLYIPVYMDGKRAGLSTSSSLEDWYTTSEKLAQSSPKGFVKILDWGASQESLDKMSSNNVSFDDTSSDGSNTESSNASGGAGAYGGHGGVYQLGNYSNAPDMNVTLQKNQSREEVLNTLMSGSYTPDEVKKCDELITSDKKKTIKTKSEK